MEITGKTPTEAPYGMHTYVCPLSVARPSIVRPMMQN